MNDAVFDASAFGQILISKPLSMESSAVMVKEAETTGIVREPLSDEEQAQGFAALERSRRRHAELLAARGGLLYPPGAEDLRAIREERERGDA